jgi:hypothetical protein
MEMLMALVAEGRGVDQEQFAALSVPQMLDGVYSAT